MFEKLELTRMAQAMAAHAGARMAVIARNVANADTPGYRTQDVADFASIYADTGVMRSSRPGHLSGAWGESGTVTVTGGPASPNGNSVSLEAEMVRSAEVRQDHEMALAVYRATSGVIRSSLGRG